MKEIVVEWTGGHPAQCLGRWIITIEGKRIVDSKDDFSDVLRNPMNTTGFYHFWYFDENYFEHFKEYEDGLSYRSWRKSELCEDLLELIKENGISLTKKEIKHLYSELQERDWRHNSCGGCI